MHVGDFDRRVSCVRWHELFFIVDATAKPYSRNESRHGNRNGSKRIDRYRSEMLFLRSYASALTEFAAILAK